ncbi:hypothetical protein AURDEDRAFT_160320 [Auricularia subglabra TFB-10046 SS5]|nr:hypothetical protein AURDEDRAFT_160320 [Auricularia subglabra TFB-10046 SS5]
MVQAAPASLLILELHWMQHACIEVAGTALMIWDYLLTLHLEIELYWGSGISWNSALFYLNRYMVLVAQSLTTYAHISTNVNYTEITWSKLTPLSCKFAIGVWLLGFGMAQVILTQIIIFVRVCALYHGRKVLHRLLLAFLIGANIIATVVVALVAKRSRGTADPYPGRKRCTVTTRYDFLWVYWIPILAYEATVCYLVGRKAYEYMKDWRKYGPQWTSGLIYIFMRDLIAYYILIFMLIVSNAVLFGNEDPSLAGIIQPLTTVLLSLMGSRWLLNLREESLRERAVPFNATGTTLAFA